MDTRTIDMKKVYLWKDRLNTWYDWTLPALIELIIGTAGKLKDWDEPEGIAVLSSCTIILGQHEVNLCLPSDEDVVNAWGAGSTSITILENDDGAYISGGAKPYPEHKFNPKTKEGYEDPVVQRFIKFIARCDRYRFYQYMLAGRRAPIITKYYTAKI